MLIKFSAKTKYFFNFVLPFALLFQWTLPTIEKEIYIHTNFGDLNLSTIIGREKVKKESFSLGDQARGLTKYDYQIVRDK